MPLDSQRGPVLEWFVIYERPRDFPAYFVVRRHWLNADSSTGMDPIALLADSLEAARALVPMDSITSADTSRTIPRSSRSGSNGKDFSPVAPLTPFCPAPAPREPNKPRQSPIKGRRGLVCFRRIPAYGRTNGRPAGHAPRPRR